MDGINHQKLVIYYCYTNITYQSIDLMAIHGHPLSKQYMNDHKAHQGTCPVSAAEIAALAVTTSAVKRLPR